MPDPIKIHVTHAERRLSTGSSAIGLPSGAEENTGKMILWTTDSAHQRKHTLFSLMQTVQIRHEDKDLDIETFSGGPFILSFGEESTEVEHGVVVSTDESGAIHLYAHEDADIRSLIRAANKYCTRWIRLDVR